MTATSAILKCPTTSIATTDCTTYVQYNEEAFYTNSAYTTEAQDSRGDILILKDM